VTSESEQIAQAERNIRFRKEALHAKQNACYHSWSEPKYEPETYQDYTFSHYESHGSDPNPVYHAVNRQRDRWSRVCCKCDKKEFTYTQKAIKLEPEFSS
jgi:hypothetical protein